MHLESRAIDSEFGGGRGDDILTSQFLYSVPTDFSVLLPSVITSVFVSAFPTIMLSFMHSNVMSRNNFLQTDSGLFLRPLVQTGFLPAVWDIYN